MKTNCFLTLVFFGFTVFSKISNSNVNDSRLKKHTLDTIQTSTIIKHPIRRYFVVSFVENAIYKRKNHHEPIPHDFRPHNHDNHPISSTGRVIFSKLLVVFILSVNVVSNYPPQLILISVYHPFEFMST